MKTIYYLLLLVLGYGLVSCYDDKSTYDTKEIPNVELDLNGVSETQYVAYLGKLHIDIPVKKNGTPDHPDLEYKWEIELSSSAGLREVLSNERVLDTIASMPIQASGYTLTLEVTDKVSTLKYYSVFSLVVESQFGEGIIVAHSRDGVTSDLSLIMDKVNMMIFSPPRGNLWMIGLITWPIPCREQHGVPIRISCGWPERMDCSGLIAGTIPS